MDDELHLSAYQRTEATCETIRRLAELEYEYNSLEPSLARDLVLTEINRQKARLEILNQLRDIEKVPVGKTKVKYRSSKKFYIVGFALLVVFLLTGAFIAGGITASVLLVNYFTTDPPEEGPSGPPPSAAVVRSPAA